MIVSSIYALDGPVQADGRRYITETHTDHLGASHLVSYLASVDADYAAILASRVPGIEERLAEEEYRRSLDSDTLTTEHITKAQAVAKFREAYRSASKEELARLATWLVNRVTNGDITATQIKAAFGLTDPQYIALRDRAIALRDHWLAVQAAVGE